MRVVHSSNSLFYKSDRSLNTIVMASCENSATSVILNISLISYINFINGLFVGNDYGGGNRFLQITI